MFANFFDANQWKPNAAIIGQMSTGEGKSIVIAMLAIFMVKTHGLNVHGLLERDHKTYLPLFKKFKIESYQEVRAEPGGGRNHICYCLKKNNQKFFSERLVNGGLKLSNTILIVDEVDDLVVNEEPTANYRKKDVDETGPFRKALKAAMAGDKDPPVEVPLAMYKEVLRWKKHAASKEKDEHYRLQDSKYVALDAFRQIPKVPKTYGWLQYLNYEKFPGMFPDASIERKTPYLTMCTPYMYTKVCWPHASSVAPSRSLTLHGPAQYKCIFGLTGSVGGDAEKAYIRKTFDAQVYKVMLL
eukprot:862541-Prymnesium_polylepis.1